MWEALMMLRLIASVGPIFSIGHGTRVAQLPLPADTLKGMIRLSFASYRLSLPPSVSANNHKNHDQKIA
ncbi:MULTISPECIES: hypothetical protein [unclassified Mesorhizobium]|uniref:hypothetical protein n=1 Tax=unclassified Mesorhizobium TaxID=325217 RepID=UPI000FD8E07F|nr:MULTISPECIES: hypothetical protein [unclassified Mesorhizobium]TGQ42082.1 hypothetical protein EN859_011920 [Mesorhizobium sp. M00.F.Ca.ET.216.01.1.1]TIS58372.1 MAG: hypothetical protein E5W91_10505 [Mesorhizobium sp.]TIS92893.1 MAG: hypothetical protein E5W89_00805 [Mesorhizobium sp.]TJW14924.1 MAG: hypothetical protein E5W82_09365 [Mesorhizobium sp.]TJW48634.1 MAG: hypothetical protein E5W83_02200 [Mesorhizobium sp.]